MKKMGLFKKVLIIIFIALIAGLVFIYFHFNQLLSDALLRSFNNSTVSDVYELKFDKLSVNLFKGNIRVMDVVLQPRRKPLQHYPYINSSFQLKARKLLLKNVELGELIKSNKLLLEKIVIEKPVIDLILGGKNPLLFPFNDKAASQKTDNKKAITGFSLKNFQLVDAAIHVTDTAAQNELELSKLNISLNDLLLDQQAGKDQFAYKNVEISIEDFKGTLHKAAIKHLTFKDLKLNIDSLQVEKTIDTLIYHFKDFGADLNALDIQSADSVFQIALGSFELSYQKQYIHLGKIVFKPNVSHADIQSNYKFQHTEFAATVGTLNIININFDSLIYSRKIFIDTIVADKIHADIYKDNTKPVDSNRLPKYFGQQISAIAVPLLIKQVKATRVNLVNTERKPDGTYGKANINRGEVTVKNITNLSASEPLIMHADAYIENRARTNLTLAFSYTKPEFSIDGTIHKFNLPDLNKLIQSYTPANIRKGIADNITFSGMIYRTNSTGTMTFLYHDLEVDLQLQEQAKWKSSVLSFAANTGLINANPIAADMPARTVKFQAERNMNKGFVNIMIKSVLSGLKETMIMSKENRKAHQELKKKSKKEKNREKQNQEK